MCRLIRTIRKTLTYTIHTKYKINRLQLQSIQKLSSQDLKPKNRSLRLRLGQTHQKNSRSTSPYLIIPPNSFPSPRTKTVVSPTIFTIVEGGFGGIFPPSATNPILPNFLTPSCFFNSKTP